MKKAVIAIGLAVGVLLVGAPVANAQHPSVAPSGGPLLGTRNDAPSGCHARIKKVTTSHSTLTARAYIDCNKRWNRKVLTFKLFRVRHHELFRLEKHSAGFGPARAGRDAASRTFDCGGRSIGEKTMRVRVFGLVKNRGHQSHVRLMEKQRTFTC